MSNVPVHALHEYLAEASILSEDSLEVWAPLRNATGQFIIIDSPSSHCFGLKINVFNNGSVAFQGKNLIAASAFTGLRAFLAGLPVWSRPYPHTPYTYTPPTPTVPPPPSNSSTPTSSSTPTITAGAVSPSAGLPTDT